MVSKILGSKWLITAIAITVVGSIIAAALFTHLFTLIREREARELRRP